MPLIFSIKITVYAVLYCNSDSFIFQDLLEVTPVSHVDRVPLQLALTQLECLAELINSRRKESEMKSQLKYLDTQISQLSKVSQMFNLMMVPFRYQIR